jgi:hypothetical protein
MAPGTATILYEQVNNRDFVENGKKNPQQFAREKNPISAFFACRTN